MKKIKNYGFDYEELLTVVDEIIVSSHIEREGNPSIIPVRVDMIVVAALITRYVIQRLYMKNVSLCTYSLKRSVFAEMMRADQ